MTERCHWALGGNELLLHYHDTEWGVPERNDQALFEKLLLDGAQAGLSWQTILDKRDGYRRAFDGFDAEVMARYGEDDVARLLADPGIVRNRLKIRSAIRNARAYLELRDELGSFSEYLWSMVGGEPVIGSWTSSEQVPAETETSVRLSKDLKKRGFNFVGPTIVYAFMQAVGMVNDHLVTCFRFAQVEEVQVAEIQVKETERGS
jgi:DNA-3-methyladenine glycosylase I